MDESSFEASLLLRIWDDDHRFFATIDDLLNELFKVGFKPDAHHLETSTYSRPDGKTCVVAPIVKTSEEVYLETMDKLCEKLLNGGDNRDCDSVALAMKSVAPEVISKTVVQHLLTSLGPRLVKGIIGLNMEIKRNCLYVLCDVLLRFENVITTDDGVVRKFSKMKFNAPINRKDVVLELVLQFLLSESSSMDTIASGLQCMMQLHCATYDVKADKVYMRDFFDVVLSGLKFISHLLLVNDKATWAEISQPYKVLLIFLYDCRAEVRNQSHLYLHDVLESFQGSDALEPASEEITNLFEWLFQLTGRWESAGCIGKKAKKNGAAEVLHVLAALRDCLPLLSRKSIPKILKYYKSLWALGRWILLRSIANNLHCLFLHPLSKAVHEELDFICFLSSDIVLNAKWSDNKLYATRLLEVGIQKIYSLDRHICILELPLLFKALAEILASERPTPLFVAQEASDALKNLMHSCIDDNLIKEGVDQIMMRMRGSCDLQMSKPTIIEEICAIIECLLHCRDKVVWDMAHSVILAMIDRLGKDSTILLKGALTSLADMSKEINEDSQDGEIRDQHQRGK